MKLRAPIRPALAAAIGLLLAATPAYARWRQGGGQKGSPPRIYRPVGPQRQQPNINGNVPRQQQRQQQRIENQGHLGDWMQKHSNMPLADQQRALQNEPGFRELPQWEQQQQLNQLARLYAMKPEARDRRLGQVEQLERMSPAQRQQYASAVQQLSAVPGPRRAMIGQAMVDLRDMPPAQREQVINSPAFAQEVPDPGDRATIRTLLTAEPYPPTSAR